MNYFLSPFFLPFFETFIFYIGLKIFQKVGSDTAELVVRRFRRITPRVGFQCLRETGLLLFSVFILLVFSSSSASFSFAWWI